MDDTDLEFREFFATQYGRLCWLGFLLTGDRAQAEDLAQEALLRTYWMWPRVRSYDRPGDYARKVLVNRHRSLLRRALLDGGQRLVVRFPGGPPGAPVDSCSPAYEATVSDDAQLVHVTVHLLLPPKMLPCRTMNHQRTLTVALPEPLRGRPLVDGGSGDARMLLGAVVREPSYLPPGYQQGGYAAGFLRLGHRMAAWQRVQRRAHAAHDQLWITQGHPAAVSLRYHPPVLHRTSVHGSPARAWKPALGGGRSGLCLSWVEGATGFQLCSVGKPTPPLAIGELERVADGLR